MICLALGLWVLPGLGIIPLRVPLGVLAKDALMTAVAGGAAPVHPALGEVAPGGPAGSARRVLIAGGGQAGGFLVKQLKSHAEAGLFPVGFVDDDPRKQGHTLHGLPVLGRLAETASVCREHAIGEILIAMPTAPGTVVRDLVRAASDAGVRTRTLPGLSDILSGRFDPFALRQVEIHDLLRREPVNIDLRQVQGLITERVVLVTGAGGSIGSELCRQVCALEPARLVLLGHGENSIFGIQQELRERFPHIPLESIIADVKDGARLGAIFERFGPYTVFHAAAHKHVPLMEENVAEAVLNNVLGTRNVVTVAAQAGTAHLVLISTDKAVRPTSVMGATKAGGGADRADICRGPGPELCRGAVRQRAGQPGQRGADVPQADCRRRPGDGDPPRDAPLLHDHPRGGAAGAAGRGAGQGR
ncbi:MAG: polysaccharide biosynthesis protein [Gemmatimonadetes bacterium]|nr:polysaccharide biosynthesis protein [Gemmatimonadota bacterium]